MSQLPLPSCLTFTLAAVLILLPEIHLDAQQENQPAVPVTDEPAVVSGSETTSDDPPTRTYLAIITEIRKNEKSISHLFSTIPIGFPEKQNQIMSEIAKLKTANIDLHHQLPAAALHDFRQSPMKDPAVTRAVFDIITGKLQPPKPEDHFDPLGALEVADVMLTHLTPTPAGSIGPTDAAYQAFRAAYAIGEFDRADSYLKKLESANLILPEAIRIELAYSKKQWERESEIRKQEAQADDLPRIKFETTEGDFTVELFENHAPQTVGNFIKLVEDEFYDELLFFNVKPGVSSQSGCKNNDGFGDAGYLIPDESDRDDVPGIQPRSHFPGTLSMVNLEPDSASSQFLICHRPNRDRDGKNTAFGRVIDGLDVVFRLNTADPQRLSATKVKPSSIIKATVVRKRNHAYSPTRIDQPASGTIPSDVPPVTNQKRSGNNKN